MRVRRALLAAELGHRAAALAAFAPWPAADVEGVGGLDEAVLASVADGEVLAGLVAPWAAPDEPVPADVIAAIGLQPAEVGPFASPVRTFVEWWQQRSSRAPAVTPGTPVDPPSWDPHRLEHRGTLAFAALPDVRLHVDQHPGGSVDWFSVDAALGDPSDLTDAPDAPQALAVAKPVDAVGVPTPATFAGMPAPRFWEFEDARWTTGRSTPRRPTSPVSCSCSSRRCTATTGSSSRCASPSARSCGSNPSSSPTRSASSTS